MLLLVAYFSYREDDDSCDLLRFRCLLLCFFGVRLRLRERPIVIWQEKSEIYGGKYGVKISDARQLRFLLRL